MSEPLEPILAHVRAEPSRTWSIVISFFGDAIVPRGGGVWLGTLLAFFAGMGIGGGAVRSAVSRLAAEDWLTRSRSGRNSFYQLAERGRETFADAAQRIYHPRPPLRQGGLAAVLLEPGSRDGARDVLAHAGFGAPLPGLFLAPGFLPATAPVVPAGALRFTLAGTAEAERALAARAWNLGELGTAYARFVAVFGPLQDSLAAGGPMAPLHAIIARVLLVHEFRRVVLRDPLLPPDVLPAGWPGEAARQLCGAIYERLLPPSERWLDETGLGPDGGPLPPATDIARRFKAPG